ncbi:MAG: hypothetical protein LKJ90_03650 [Faecalibacterium sp.]|jgi:hypothetical protein|nr:hypothetical protein [Faecalibacterium sp.]
MRHKELRLGSITLLFTVVILCVTALCALTVATAHADAAVADKYAAQVAAYYETESAGQAWLAQVDAAVAAKNGDVQQSDLPAGCTITAGTISAELDTQNGRTLQVSLRLEGGGRYQITCWQNTAVWQEDSNIGGLWEGSFPT